MRRATIWILVLILLIVGAYLAYRYWLRRPPPPPPVALPHPQPLPPKPPAASQPVTPAPAAAMTPQGTQSMTAQGQAAQAQLPQAPPGPPLPKLTESDPTMGQSVTGLVGTKPFKSLFLPHELIRRIVATVDNLPRARAPVQMWPVQPLDSPFLTEGSGGNLMISPKNYARYAPYVAIAEAIDPKKLVDVYVRLYPLFQQAYEELGYPRGRFNDRLIEAIDDMLAAPEKDNPIKLVQPKVLYEYADPDLEARSAGQKILMRMGIDNEDKVKAKLREIRKDIIQRFGNP